MSRTETYQKRSRRRAIKGALYGALVSVVLGSFVGPMTWGFVLLCAVSGGAVTLVVLKLEWSSVASIALYGGTGILLTWFGIRWGLAAGNCGPQTLLFVWVMYVICGALIGMWADLSKTGLDE